MPRLAIRADHVGGWIVPVGFVIVGDRQPELLEVSGVRHPLGGGPGFLDDRGQHNADRYYCSDPEEKG